MPPYYKQIKGHNMMELQKSQKDYNAIIRANQASVELNKKLDRIESKLDQLLAEKEKKTKK